MPTRIVILGSTGSIGRQALQVVEALGDQFQVFGLAAGRNLDLLAQQAQRFRPSLIAADASPAEIARHLDLPSLGASLASPEALAACAEADLVLVATTGKAGLAPSLAALRAGKRLALANKEVLVMAGAILRKERARCGGVIRPIDSEHSALWQCLLGEGRCHPSDGEDNMVGLCQVAPLVKRLILTASGGAFRDHSREELRLVTAAQALRHPTWQMGPRVTIDSATLVNKGLEVIEAHWLFGVPFEQIEVVIHRESVVHSLVEFVDGSLKAQLGVPDMRLPIQYALTFPQRCPSGLPGLDLVQVGSLSFVPADLERFAGLQLALEAGRRGGTYPAVLAASDEVAVELFLQNRIGFLDIPELIERVLQAHRPIGDPDLAEILLADEWARGKCLALAGA